MKSYLSRAEIFRPPEEKVEICLREATEFAKIV